MGLGLKAYPRALRTYGLALAGAELLCAGHWQLTGAAKLLAPGAEALCWPFLERCFEWRSLPLNILFGLHALLSIAAIVAFVRDKSWARWLLLAADVVKLVVVVQDYQLRLNQHYMTSFVVWTYALQRDPRASVRWLIVAFYFSAGLLKLNATWLSGDALYQKPWLVPESLIPAACAYVVALELLIAPWLLSSRRWLVIAALAQLAVFHLLSWPVVSAYYPLLMLLLLSCFVLPGFFVPTSRAIVPPLAVFALLQLSPLAYPGDRTVTGEGRWLALHMFDARVKCAASAVYESETRSLLSALPSRIACDPLVFFRRAQALCRQGGRDFAFTLVSTPAKGEAPRIVANVANFCAQNLHYRVWPPNDWLRRDK